MLYLITFTFIRCGGQQFILEGPADFDVSNEFTEWKKEVIEKSGPQPNIAVYCSHREWLIRHMQVLKDYQEKYQYEGDFLTIFIEHLVQRHGFQRRDVTDVQLT